MNGQTCLEENSLLLVSILTCERRGKITTERECGGYKIIGNENVLEIIFADLNRGEIIEWL